MNDAKITERLYAETPDESTRKVRRLRSVLLNRTVCSIGASLGIFGGVSSLASGVLCVVIHSVIPADEIFGRAATALLILGIPLLLAGAVFMDEIK